MKRLLMLAATITSLTLQAQLKDFSTYPVYTGKDLGLTYTKQQSAFRIWAPTATKAVIHLYKNNTTKDRLSSIDMKKAKAGTWTATLTGNQENKYYTFQVLIDGKWSDEVVDPYVKCVGINGKRGMIADMQAQTNSSLWAFDTMPAVKPTDPVIIYELHIRDATINPNSGLTYRGTFTGLSNEGKNEEGLSTGLAHLKEMGVTHIHLLPFFDFNSIDESSNKPQYNWGYDPLNYNAPEGSYSATRTGGWMVSYELKNLIIRMHQAGLRVVMDVVYNHTGLTANSNFNQLVPGYYYRQKKDGSFSDATACENEVASERPMVRKFMLESLKYWVEEYHIDGFRFDLMGVHDIVTMNLISRELNRIKPGILLYGEGWTAGASPLPDSVRALKVNAPKLEHIAVFSDDIRDGIKGSVFDHADRGFVSNKPGMEESIKFGIVASCFHPQINYSKVNYSKAPYAESPASTITYAECHDNHVLWDKLAISAGNYSEAQRRNMHKLALSIVLTSQGIPFLHAGTEFLRSKKGVENSYNAGDSINAIDWSLKSKNIDVVNYVKGLIAIRKAHPSFRLQTAKQIQEAIQFRDSLPSNVIVYTINGRKAGDEWEAVMVILNGSDQPQTINEVHGWKTAVVNNELKEYLIMGPTFTIQPFSCSVLYR